MICHKGYMTLRVGIFNLNISLQKTKDSDVLGFLNFVEMFL